MPYITVFIPVIKNI